MCRLLGLIGTPPLPAKDALEAFYPLCTEGCVKKGMTPGHSDGWGISGFHDGRAVYFERQAEPAGANSTRYEEATHRATMTETPVVLAHFRKASGSGPSIANTHPFHYRDWIFAHNGTIFGAPASFSLNESEPQGNTDSELFFLWMWERVHAEIDATAALVALLKKARQELVYTSLNFMMSDGHTFWAYREFGDKRLEAGETLKDRETYYTLYWTAMGKSVVVCSEALPKLSKNWTAMDQRTLAVFTPDKPAPKTYKI